MSASPADAFTPADAALVVRLAQVRAAISNPVTLLPDYLALVRIELALCRALRLSPQTRMHARTAGRMAGRARPSIYEVMDGDGD